MLDADGTETPENRYSADRREFFRRAFIFLGFNGIDGDYVEFGCFGGVTFKLAYEESRGAAQHLAGIPHVAQNPSKVDRNLWAIDSFAGLPAQRAPEDEHPAWIEGTLLTTVEEFHLTCERNAIPRSAYTTVEGYYEDTLGEHSAWPLPADISLAYVDCDLYSSIRTVLAFLMPRLKHGMILALDDYFCYSPTQVSGARRACVESFGANAHWRLVPYVQYSWGCMSFIVESKRILEDGHFSALSSAFELHG